ncbi:MAG: hypothetical protein LBE70_04280 [Nitrososphaerota archaeon]|nr:hypothetical protein [Nitrososphaerota archaeon]
MSELVQALWFEDVGFLHEQMLDTPVGRFSIRQMGIFLIFGFLAWLSSLVFADLVLKVVVAGAIFFAGAALFTRKIKTVSPEAHLLYMTRRFTIQTKQRRSAVKVKSSVEQVSKSLLLSATLGAPVKIVGILKDVTGQILSGKNFQVNINNTTYAKGSTDEEGCFCTYFVTDRSGVFQLDIQPEGSTEAVQQITVNVQPKVEEENKHAETIKTKI